MTKSPSPKTSARTREARSPNRIVRPSVIAKLPEWWCVANGYHPPCNKEMRWNRDMCHGAWRVLNAIVRNSAAMKEWRAQMPRPNDKMSHE